MYNTNSKSEAQRIRKSFYGCEMRNGLVYQLRLVAFLLFFVIPAQAGIHSKCFGYWNLGIVWNLPLIKSGVGIWNFT